MTAKQQSIVLMKRWNKSLGLLHDAQEQFKALIDEFEWLGDEVSDDEREEFNSRMIDMRALNLDLIGDAYFEFQNLQFPLDGD